MENIPDNYDLWEAHEAELKRLTRMRKRQAAAYDREEMEDYEDE